MSKILIIDDEEKLRGLLARITKLEGHEVIEAGKLGVAFKLRDKESIDVILCDVKLPDGNGVDFITELKTKFPFAEIILLTAHGNISDGVTAMKNGAFDYITKGNDNERIIPLISKAIEKVELQKRVQQLEKQVAQKYNFESIIGSSGSIKEAISLAQKVAPTGTNVLLLGETGTGKEIFAQAIHNASSRVSKPFLAINCSTFSNELLESEIFGHRAGAFTGALKDKKGLVEEANSGTLFLDEIGELPVELQAKLLRVLETGEFIKVGDTVTTKVDVRIIAATNRNLEEAIKEHKFRDDLFYRLNVFTITLPPLRERKEDIPALTDFFVSIFASKTNKRIKGVTTQVINILQNYYWKGNIRELKNVIERAIILEDGEWIGEKNLPFDLRNEEENSTHSMYELNGIEKKHIQKVLQITHGNKTETANLLGIGLTTLYRKIEEYQIK